MESPGSVLGMMLMNIFHEQAWLEGLEGGRKVKLGHWANQQPPTDRMGWGGEIPPSLAFLAHGQQFGQVELLEYLQA